MVCADWQCRRWLGLVTLGICGLWCAGACSRLRDRSHCCRLFMYGRNRDPWVGGSLLSAPWTSVRPECRMGGGLEVSLQAWWLSEAHTACRDTMSEMPGETSFVLLGQNSQNSCSLVEGSV